MTKIFILLLLLTALAACSREISPPELLAPLPAQLHMDTAVVARGTVAEVQQHTGVVRASADALNFGVATGFMQEVYVLPGVSVYQGQVLARLDFTQAEVQLERLQQQLANMRRNNAFDNELRTIDIELRRLTLGSLGGEEAEIMRLEIERSNMELRHTRERQALTIRHLEEDIQALEAQLALGELVAPFDGEITFRSHHMPGVWVSSFATIFYIAPAYGDVFVEYIGFSQFSPAFAARIKAHVDGEIYDVSHIRLPLEIARRYARPPIRFLLDADTQPPVGTLVSLHVYSRLAEDVLRIPRNALFHDPDMGFYVYRIVDGRQEAVVISLGVRTSTYVEVLGGLVEGEVVYVRA
ncbi:MAG: hypothetical protein FWE42_01190 [Defluviitaleaceae bacterium]|nr:hypothetical protein [Defluviitaleaceae bacterium]